MRKIILREKFDIVHAHNIYGGLTTSVLDLLNQNKIPIVMTLHDYKLICPNYKLMHHSKTCEECKKHKYIMAIKNRCHKNSIIASTIYSLETYFNFIFDKYHKNIFKFISPSRFLQKKFCDFGWSKSSIKYIPNYIDIKNVGANYRPGKYFLYIGRLSSEKGINTLIRAFKKIKSNNARLVIVGDGPIRNELRKISMDDNRIEYTGYLSGNALKEKIEKSKAIIVPSEWYENAPLSILEAFAVGKPVIGAHIGGIPEMIEHKVNGFHFESGNIDDLKEKMELMLGLNDDDITNMGMNARKKIDEEYNSKLHYDNLMQVYTEAINHS